MRTNFGPCQACPHRKFANWFFWRDLAQGRRCDDPIPPCDVHQANTNVKEAQLCTWLLFQAPDDCVLPAHGVRRIIYI